MYFKTQIQILKACFKTRIQISKNKEIKSICYLKHECSFQNTNTFRKGGTGNIIVMHLRLETRIWIISKTQICIVKPKSIFQKTNTLTGISFKTQIQISKRKYVSQGRTSYYYRDAFVFGNTYLDYFQNLDTLLKT